MGKRLSTKNRKSRRDKATAYKAEGRARPHKIAEERSRKAKFKKNHPA